MLPARHRLRRSPDFRETVRRGRRAGSRHLVVHLVAPPGTPEGSGVPAAVGLVVSKAVGGSVVRHRVQRRLRHLLAARVGDLPAGSRLVVRANPAAAGASSAELAADLDRGLRSLHRPRRAPAAGAR